MEIRLLNNVSVKRLVDEKNCRICYGSKFKNQQKFFIEQYAKKFISGNTIRCVSIKK